jgi:hypothetical protein
VCMGGENAWILPSYPDCRNLPFFGEA